MNSKLQFNSVSARIFTCFTGLILFLCVIIYLFVRVQATTLNTNEAKANLSKQAHLAFEFFDRTYAGDWMIQDGFLYKGGQKINDGNVLVDEIYQNTGLFMTVFQGDTRVATNVQSEGKRMVGTQAGQTVIDQVLAQGATYVGEAKVTGIDTLACYEPIKDASGGIIGMIFLGLPMEEARLQLTVMLNTLLGIMIFLILAAIFMTWIVARSISKSIRTAAGSASRLATGDVCFTLDQNAMNRPDEIGVLMRAMDSFLAGQQQKAAAAVEISRGNLDIVITEKSDQDILSLSMRQMVNSLRRMSEETTNLTRFAVQGNLTERGKAETFEGVYRDIVMGINQTLDAMTEPLQDAGRVLTGMAHSDLSQGMQSHYQGSFQELALQLDAVRDLFLQIQDVFILVADQIGRAAVGTILTGMGGDGAKGLLAMRSQGARTIGQNEASCVVYGMPKVAFDIGAVEKQLPISQIADELIRLSRM